LVNIPVASRVADQILCLPIFPDMAQEVRGRLIEIIFGKTVHTTG
jgi:dTDP-4-amino-4,6-dideoxygalactose transaminase